MELRRYARVMMRWKWLVALGFVVTVSATAALVLPQRPIYESSGTWLLRPALRGDVGNSIDASDVLSRTGNVAASYATIARSDLMVDRAFAALGRSADAHTDVSAEVLTDTNILSISARGPDAQLDHDLVAAVGDQITAYVTQSDDVYTLESIDEPKLSRDPVAPNKRFTLAVGVVLGLMLGAALALFAEYLKSAADAEGRDPTGLELKSLWRMRLRQHMTQTDRTGQPFAVGLLRVTRRDGVSDGGSLDGAPTPEDVRRVEELLRLAVADEVVTAYLGGGDFATILPEARADGQEMLIRWRDGISLLLQRDGSGSMPPTLSIGVCEYLDGRFVGDAVTTRAVSALMNGNAVPGRSGPSDVVTPSPTRNGSEPAGHVDVAHSPAITHGRELSDPASVGASSASRNRADASDLIVIRYPSSSSDKQPSGGSHVDEGSDEPVAAGAASSVKTAEPRRIHPNRDRGKTAWKEKTRAGRRRR